jgi:hypothetical protein
LLLELGLIKRTLLNLISTDAVGALNMLTVLRGVTTT